MNQGLIQARPNENPLSGPPASPTTERLKRVLKGGPPEEYAANPNPSAHQAANGAGQPQNAKPRPETEVAAASGLAARDTMLDPGDNVTITLTAGNAGPDEAPNTSVQVRLPEGLTYSSHNTATGTYDSASGVWTIGDLIVSKSPLLVRQAGYPRQPIILNLKVKDGKDEHSNTDGENDDHIKVVIIVRGSDDYNAN